MDVYHDTNMWGKGSPETKLAALPINQSCYWEEQEILVPAVYVGKAGVVLDVCARIPAEDMAAFLKKWNYERRMSLKTNEEFELMEADNPSSRELAAEICLDGTALKRSMSSSIRWYPKSIIQMENLEPASEDGFDNDKYAEEWMAAYGCNRKYCWNFTRLSYNWNGEPILSPEKISLTFQANLIPITTGHFFTGASCNGEKIKTTHPITGQEYTLTLHECEQTRHSFADIGAKGMVYPEYCRILSYSVSPEINRSLFSIHDCAEGDKPRKGDAQETPVHIVGASAIFMAGKSAATDRISAASSLHFEPVTEVQWRIIFRIKPKADMEISFPIVPNQE